MSRWMRSMAGREWFGCDPACACVAVFCGDGGIDRLLDSWAGSAACSWAAEPTGSGGVTDSVIAGSLVVGASVVSDDAPSWETMICGGLGIGAACFISSSVASSF